MLKTSCQRLNSHKHWHMKKKNQREEWKDKKEKYQATKSRTFPSNCVETDKKGWVNRLYSSWYEEADAEAQFSRRKYTIKSINLWVFIIITISCNSFDKKKDCLWIKKVAGNSVSACALCVCIRVYRVHCTVCVCVCVYRWCSWNKNIYYIKALIWWMLEGCSKTKKRKENESYMHGSLFIWETFECVGFDSNTTSCFRLKAAPIRECR